MTVQLAGAPHSTARPARWRVALVNNMPDAAFRATDRQFAALLQAGAGGHTVAMTRHTMTGIPRGDRISAHIAAGYEPLDHISADPPDLLVVTGSNPIESRIQDEAYWADLHSLLTWGSANVPVMMLSCLSAHAALAVFDGLQRTTLPVKCTGVFRQAVDPSHPLAARFRSRSVLPHSRLNTVPADAMHAAGYAVLMESAHAGWSIATKTVGRCEVVLMQAHPEYDPSSLVREYARDLRRYLSREHDDMPRLPVDCVAGRDWDLLRRLHRRVIDGDRDPALLSALQWDEMVARAAWPWRGTAKRLYANLLATVPQRSV